MKQDMIVILDLGSEENARLAREIRALGVYSEIHPHDIGAEGIKALPNVKGVILNGGKNRIVDGVEIDAGDLSALNIPVLSVDHKGAAPWAEEMSDRLNAISDFIFDSCKCEKNWNVENFISDQVELLRAQIGDGKVVLALSGGVDSSVVAALLIKAIGDRLTCIHVNHGLLRKGEPEQVVEVFGKQLGAELIYVDATERFLGKLEGVDEPEAKRKIIGEEFIRLFEEEARKLQGYAFLGQGTIYPDIIESGTKTAKVVKSHHNVGGLPEDFDFELVEPLKMLFKDEVRAVGAALGLPDNMVYRQPFPGPGLGVRCTGAITRDRLEALRESDAILREEFDIAGLRGKVWQYFTVVPDFKSTGVKDNQRSYDWPCIIRAVNTVDAMTAEVAQIPWDVLQKITYRITHEVDGINRVLFDLTPKPTGTIEWE
ncbi:MAG: glutamine-hydrolyzing GMP synthase [Oscillospiraceae bacterium]|nr:glutamine-hydrolyzing GMP synthase [Oscillospiraceae bacterium]